MTTVRQPLGFFAESAKWLPAKRRRFDDSCEGFPQNVPIWSEQFDAVWSWHDWPNRPVGLPDTGIDPVALERGSSDIVAVQRKFYAPTASLSWQNTSMFVAFLSQVEG